jgi:hypothetical protein
MLADMTRLVTGLDFRRTRMLVEQMRVAAIVLLRGLRKSSKVVTPRESGGLCIIRVGEVN